MIESFAATDPGCVRANNEDYFLVIPSLGLYLVADGMGGAQAGEHASRLAAETVADVLEKSHQTPDSAILIEALTEANRRVMEQAATDPGLDGMGTTLVAAAEAGEDLLIASVGDSRLYTFDGTLCAVTEDQTWVNEVGRRLGLDEATLRQHPMRHVLTMAIGVANPLRVHSYRVRPTAGMLILLCSDGLHGVIEDSEIAEVLAGGKSLADMCSRLIVLARANGGPDNITVVLLRSA